MKYQIELIWNRSFHFVPYLEPSTDLEAMIKLAFAAENMGDGDRVKKARIVDENGAVVWQYGKLV